MSKFKLDAMIFCRMSLKCNHFYDMIEDHNQRG